MPAINQFKCKNCGFSLPLGWGGYIYVKNDKGDKIPCAHPGEGETVAEVLGIDRSLISHFPWLPLPKAAPADLIKERVGFDSHCICLTCLNQFNLDVEKEDRHCPKCHSREVRTELEMVGQPCPRCNAGIIEEIETGLVT